MKTLFFTLLLSSFTLISCEKTQEIATPNAGEVLLKESITAHGGSEKWHSNGLLQFRWTYHMTDKGAVVDSIQTVDPTSFSITHTVPDSEVRFGMTNNEAWIHPADATFTPPPRFWALTPTYFIGIPFVFDDSNARFELLEESKTFEGKDYSQVKITYTSTAGDSPDDYYVLLIDPVTKLTRAAYYIVTHPLVAPNGPGPEKLITLDELKNVNGLMLASGHRTFSMEDGKIGPLMRHTDVSGVKFLPRGSVDLSIPENAKKF